MYGGGGSLGFWQGAVGRLFECAGSAGIGRGVLRGQETLEKGEVYLNGQVLGWGCLNGPVEMGCCTSGVGEVGWKCDCMSFCGMGKGE